MKTSLQHSLLLYLLVVLVYSCQSSDARFEGIYVSHEVGDESVSEDTLIIKQVDARIFTVERHTGYREFVNSIPTPKKRSQKTYHFEQVAESGVLVELKTGKTLTPADSWNVVLLGYRKFQRLK